MKNSFVSLSTLILIIFLCSPHVLMIPRSREGRVCPTPPIDFEAQETDVLGDREKGNICALPRPTSLCKNVGPADETCKKIAKKVGGTSDVSCSHPNTCKFLVKRPILDPETPEYAYVSLCEPEFVGIIFPCPGNNLRIVNPFYNIIDNPNILKPAEPFLSIDTCGKIDESIEAFIYNRKKITIPQETVRGQFPWQAALYRQSITRRSTNYEQFCGGSVISEQHILTAGHCFDRKPGDEYNYKVILGDYSKGIHEDFEQEFQFDTSMIHIHPNYVSSVTHSNFDVAIIKLPGALQFNKYIKPICLPSKNLQLKSDMYCFISGWGYTNERNGDPTTLQAASVPTMESDQCKDKYPGNFDQETMICAGEETGGADTCKGDSGGPLICDVMDVNNNHYQIQMGITSWGSSKCGEPNKPGVYTNLIHFRDWIDKVGVGSVQNILRDVNLKSKD